MNAPTTAPTLADWAESLYASGHADITVKSYVRTVEAVADRIGQDVTALRPRDVRLAGSAYGRPLKPSTLARYTLIVRTWANYVDSRTP